MSEATKLNSNRNIIILAVIVIAIVVAGTMIYQENQKETVSINIGGKEISATFEK